MKRRPTHHQTDASRRRLWNHKGGNIALITAFVMIPLTFAMGMAFDYTLSRSRQDQLDGMADAAVLGAVTPTEMGQPWATAAAQATSLFNGQAAGLSGAGSVVPVITGGDTSSGATVTRTVTLTYTAKSQNVFASLLGMPALTISGTSTSTSATAPNIDFYLMLDTSPSMEIAATTAGMTTMVANTQDQSDSGTTDGCEFGCHQSNPGDLASFKNSSGGQIQCTTSGAYADGTTFNTSSKFPTTGRDNYDLTRCLGVTLRIDLLNAAAQNLMTSATATEAIYNSTYRMALYETDFNQSTAAGDLSLFALQSRTSNLTLAKTQAATLGALEVYENNLLTSTDNNNDMDTTLDSDIVSMNALMPAPGHGTNNPGDTPQEVLFIVTDALNDEGPSRQYPPMDWNGVNCAAVKARGIRIAVLYTQYIPMTAPTDWYETNVVPTLPSGLPPVLATTAPSTPVGTDPMALAAQQCASPGLYYEVTTNGDISTALNTLFQEAVTTARLSH